jgi:hypothetical protein
VVPDGRRLVRLPDAGEHPPFSLALVGLDPNQSVDQVRGLPPPGTVPFDDQQRAARRNLDRAVPAVLGPSRRAVADGPALVHRLQDPGDEQVGPAEARVPPRDVVGVNDSRSGDSAADPRGQCGLAGVAAPVYCQDDRTAGRNVAASSPDHRVNEGGEQLGTPRPRFWLLGC